VLVPDSVQVPDTPDDEVGRLHAERDQAYGLLRWLTRTYPVVLAVLVEISEREFWLDGVLIEPNEPTR
jgi:hypothetical protein